MRTDIQRLAIRCRRWGGELRIHDFYTQGFLEGGGWSEAPFVNEKVAIHWKKRIIVIPPGYTWLGGIIHEMGHVFASKEPPERSEEWSWIGWEMALAKQIDLDRWLENNYYCIDFEYQGKRFWELKQLREEPEALGALMKERIGAAKAAGLVSRHGAPLCIR